MTPSFPCAVCGTAITRRPADARRPRHLTCPRCRYMIYDYPRSAAGMLVVKGDRVLLLERAHAPRVGFLDIPGGFIEAGETIEAAARRELREESGLTLGRVESLGFYWDTYFIRGFGRFPVMNFYFAGRWRRGEPMAADDAASAAWIPLGSLPRLRKRFAWAHMTALLGDFRRWARRG
jgi:ADP-ribose pyrophosphatase YjhB (NUDIX family)